MSADKSSKVRLLIHDRFGKHWKELSLSRMDLYVGGTLFLAFLISLMMLISGYMSMLMNQSQDRVVMRENEQLRLMVSALEERVGGMQAELNRVQKFSHQIQWLNRFRSRQKGVAAPTQLAAKKMEYLPIGPLDISEDLIRVRRLQQGSAEQVTSLLPKIGEVSPTTMAMALSPREAFTLWGGMSDENTLLFSTPILEPVNGWFSSGYGYRKSPFSKSSKFHRGLDIAAQVGAPIYAPADGVIEKVDYDSGYGNHIAIKHGFGFVTRYAHCSETLVTLGQKVRRGDMIGRVGTSGRSTGPHLHYEIHLNGNTVDPKKYILR